MATNLTLAEELLYTTVKLTTKHDLVHTGSGTGFFWQIDLGEGESSLLLVTNRHVVEGSNRVKLMCHLADNDGAPSGKFTPITIDLEQPPLQHPAGLDLVAIGFTSAYMDSEKRGNRLYVRSLSIAQVPTADEWDNLDAIEEVLMVGCPRGISDTANNFPIVRRGISATQIARDYEGRPEFLIDMACFPGSSGSPVFINQVGYFDRKANTYQLGSRRFHFVGILYAGPLITNDGVIVFGQQPKVEVAAMMHLGQVIRSTAMRELEELVRSKIKKAKGETASGVYNG